MISISWSVICISELNRLQNLFIWSLFPRISHITIRIHIRLSVYTPHHCLDPDQSLSQNQSESAKWTLSPNSSSVFLSFQWHMLDSSDSLFNSNHWLPNINWRKNIFVKHVKCYVSLHADYHMSWERRSIVYNVMILVKLWPGHSGQSGSAVHM